MIKTWKNAYNLPCIKMGKLILTFKPRSEFNYIRGSTQIWVSIGYLTFVWRK